MSNPPSPPPLPQEPFPEGDPIPYQGPGAKTSGMAMTSMILGIIGVVTVGCLGIGLIPCIVALILGIISLVAINKDPGRLGGKGYSIAGIALGACGFLVLPLMIAILLPSLGRAREMANRGTCAANLRDMVQSMAVYSNDWNDAFPVVPYAEYGPANGGTMPGLTGGTDQDAALRRMYAAGSPVAGSPLAGPWILVATGSVPPKQFICKSDENAKSAAPAQMTDGGGNYFLMFQADNQISYSFAYPYTAEGKVGGWWKNMTDSSLPVASDMAPLSGTGSPAHNPAVGSGREANSGNHRSEGQNVVYGDNHVDFVRSPGAGQDGDNIFTSNGGGAGSPAGIAPRLGPINVGGVPGGYDTLMVPARNLDTGKLW